MSSRMQGFRHTSANNDRCNGYDDYLAEKKEIATRSRGVKTKAGRWFTRVYISEYQLYRGKTIFPRQKRMTAEVMFECNRVFEDAFVEKLDKGIDSTLWSWKHTNYKAYKAARFEFIRLVVCGGTYAKAFRTAGGEA